MWNFPLFPEQASSNASRVDALFLFELVILTFFTTLICVLIVSFAIRYRRGSKVDRSSPPSANHLLEAIWIIVPLGLSLVMFAWSALVFYELYEPPADAFEISVDVVLATSAGPCRDQQSPCAVGSARQAGDDFAGCDP